MACTLYGPGEHGRRRRLIHRRLLLCHTRRGPRKRGPHTASQATPRVCVRPIMHTVASHDFEISSAYRHLDISSDALPGGAAPSDASAGGVRAVGRLCAGVPVYTQVCWRIKGSDLELSETSLLPGVELRDAALRVSFPSGLLPAVGVAQLNNDALLILFAMHAPPPGGIFVCVLHFELPPDRGLVRGAVALHDSWFARDPTFLVSRREKTYIEPVGKSLGAARTGAFDEHAPVHVGERMWRTSLLLAGEAAHALQVTLLLDFDRLSIDSDEDPVCATWMHMHALPPLVKPLTPRLSPHASPPTPLTPRLSPHASHPTPLTPRLLPVAVAHRREACRKAGEQPELDFRLGGWQDRAR